MQRREADTHLNVNELIKNLKDNFNLLADDFELRDREVQILRQKLRFSIENYQQLAAKYAPTDPEITNTIAQLQLLPGLHDQTEFVALPSRKQISSTQQTAEAIKEGRRASRRLSILHGWKDQSASTGAVTPSSGNPNGLRTSYAASLSPVLEQDFTVPGKKSDLACPFVPMAAGTAAYLSASQNKAGLQPPMTPTTNADHTPHHSGDPICAAMNAETNHSAPPSANGSATAKCPIRYLDRHSPEEVAQYFETHKHEIPRSHEICVKRYQRNEEDIRKLDAKYGTVVSMLQGLAPIHQPMMPTSEDEQEEQEIISNERVENWATSLTATGLNKIDEDDTPTAMNQEDDRESRFDRPMKEVRLGESPSRPWGISVPFSVESRPSSRPAQISPSLGRSAAFAPQLEPAHGPVEPIRKCPFSAKKDNQAAVPRPAGQCPFGGALKTPEATKPQELNQTATESLNGQGENTEERPAAKDLPLHQASPPPTFIQPQDINKQASSGGPQMVFTGPVFIGYPIEQAMALMQQYRAGSGG